MEHRIPDIHPNIREAPVVDCGAGTVGASFGELPPLVALEHTDSVVLAVDSLKGEPVLDNRMVSIREVVPVVWIVSPSVAVAVVLLVVDGTLEGNLAWAWSVVVASEAVRTDSLAVLRTRVLAGTLVAKVHSFRDSVVVLVMFLRRTSPFDSDMGSVSSLDYSTLPPWMP